MDTVVNIPACSLVPLLRCNVCQGFLIDATALPECGHYFCKTCIVQHCARSTVCPVAECRTYIHARPLTCLKKDTTLQTLVYKLFPEIYHNEMSRRRIYFKNYPDDLYDASVHGLDAESTGSAENPSWLPEIFIPFETEVHLNFKHSLTAHLRADFPAELQEKEAKACKHDLATMCVSTVRIEELKAFIVDYFRLPSSISIIILQANSVMDDPQTIADMVRFSCGSKADRKILELSFIFLPASELPPTHPERQDFVHRCFQKEITLHVPLSGRMKAPKKRGVERRGYGTDAFLPDGPSENLLQQFPKLEPESVYQDATSSLYNDHVYC